MTFMYGVQWPYEASPEPDLIPKWTHAALAENDFMSEWEASAQACNLAFELGMTFAPTTDRDCEHRPKRGRLSVSFASTVKVFFGCDDLIKAHAVEVLHEVLASPNKPWSLRPQFPASLSSSTLQVQNEPRFHVDHAEFMPACIHDDHAFICDSSLCRYRHFVPIPEVSHTSWYDYFHDIDSVARIVDADPMSLSAAVISNFFGQFIMTENQAIHQPSVSESQHTELEVLLGGADCIDPPDSQWTKRDDLEVFRTHRSSQHGGEKSG